MNNFKFIDLFCGVGGFHLAMKRAVPTAECVLACDIDKKCRETYLTNFGVEPVSNVKYIDEKTMPDFDALCAGFPCQPFSNGGKKKSFEDDRGLLFDEIIRIAKHKKPKFMFLENVKHILKVSNGEVFEYIKTKIDMTGYHLQIFQLSPHNYGIPQQRERVFFVCVRKDLLFDDAEGEGEGEVGRNVINLIYENQNLTVDDIVKQQHQQLGHNSSVQAVNDNVKRKRIPKNKNLSKTDGDVHTTVLAPASNKYHLVNHPDIYMVLNAWDELVKQFEVGEKISPTILIHDYFRTYTDAEFDTLPDWKRDYMTKNKPLLDKYIDIITEWYEKYKDILSKREIYGKLEWQVGVIKENDSIYNYFIQIRQSGIRVKKPQYFPTLVAISQIPIYGKTRTYLTPRECARLQCFPEEFILDESDKVVYKQMGNSVNVYNVFMVINSTLKHFIQ